MHGGKKIACLAAAFAAVIGCQTFAPIARAQQEQQPPAQPQQEQSQRPQPQQPQPAQAQQPQQPDQRASDLQRFWLEGGVSIDVGPNWKPTGAVNSAPPGGLGPYAPPFRFNQLLFLANEHQFTVLQLATSDNPLIGHDAYWLDTQMHSLDGSGMSLPDYLFFLFLPPSHSCMDDVLARLASASRGSPPGGGEFDQSELQVTYNCTYSPTLSDFFSQQLTNGITFRQALNGPRAYGDFKNLELPPMEQVDFNGMTFFVFEALSREQISENAVHYYNLPVETQGLHADFFWAVGAVSPFPFVADPSRRNNPIIHLAYAGAGPNRRTDFMRMLQRIRVAGAAAAAAPAEAASPQ